MATEEARAIEAILMVADEPIPPGLLAELLEIPPARVDAVYRFQSHPDLAPDIERFVLEGQSARMSAAALETLAIVAYKQPVSRAQFSAIRGVNVDGVIRTLQQRGLIEEVARDPGPGLAVLYGTTTLFLERLGIDTINDLPPLGAFVPDADVVEALEKGLLPDDSELIDVTELTDDPARPDDDGPSDDTEVLDEPEIVDLSEAVAVEAEDPDADD